MRRRWLGTAAAAGAVAAIGLSAHKAEAQPVDNDAVQPSPQPTTAPTTAPAPREDLVPDEDRRRLEEAEAARKAAESRPPGDGPVRPDAKPITLTEIAEPPTQAAGDVAEAVVAATGAVKRVVAAVGESRPALPQRIVVPRAVRVPRSPAPPVPPPATPAPIPPGRSQSDEPIPPAAAAAIHLTASSAPKATPPTPVPPAQAGDEWYPAWATDMADQRIAEKWGNAPVRGPPPSAASALGSDARTTTTQVSVVRGPSGTTVTISQNATVDNVGVATADGGPTAATGNRSDTLITQVTVIKQRGGTGTATVDQNADVDNAGVAHATSAGTGAATAVGNDSTTNVTQVAVIYVHGSGDARVSQDAAVENVGVASASANGRDAVAVGNQSSTDVTQVAVVHLHDEDVNVGQKSTTRNIGVAASTGGTAIGNTATNTTTQVAHR